MNVFKNLINSKKMKNCIYFHRFLNLIDSFPLNQKRVRAATEAIDADAKAATFKAPRNSAFS